MLCKEEVVLSSVRSPYIVTVGELAVNKRGHNKIEKKINTLKFCRKPKLYFTFLKWYKSLLTNIIYFKRLLHNSLITCSFPSYFIFPTNFLTFSS